MTNNSVTAIHGIRVGHATDLEGATGCTVILCPEGTVGGVDQRGGAPGTRETDLLRPMHLVENVHAIVLSGGSAYGLATADGVMGWLEEQGIGYDVMQFKVPIVPAAILMDLLIGQEGKRPTAQMGYQACENATNEPVQSGNVGVGTGCTVGKLLGPMNATKSGLGSHAIHLGNGLIVAALVAVNAFGDILDEQNSILAGIRNPEGEGFLDSLTIMQSMLQNNQQVTDNTVIGVVVSNAKLSKEATNKVAQMAQDGLARAIVPAHTMYDGDTIFALSTGEIDADVNLVGALAAQAFTEAIRDGVRSAETLHNIKSVQRL